jgi:3-isopropylmalate/(R)-2-methylmalate dehydratase small subunit
MKLLTGRCVAKLGDDVNTDLIYPGKYLKIFDLREMAEHALDGIQKDFWKSVTPGDILVAGRNFGCGSSRTQSVASLRAVGIQAVIASSFARSFYRNGINQGLPVIVCVDCCGINVGENVIIDFENYNVRTATVRLPIEPYPPFLLDIIERGGLTKIGKEIVSGRYQLWLE